MSDPKQQKPAVAGKIVVQTGKQGLRRDLIHRTPGSGGFPGSWRRQSEETDFLHSQGRDFVFQQQKEIRLWERTQTYRKPKPQAPGLGMSGKGGLGDKR